MEIISRPFDGKRYWNKKGYTLLDGATATKRKIQVVKIKGKKLPSGGLSRFWKIKRVPRLRLISSAYSPKTLWKRFKDGYVNMMLRLGGGAAGGEFQGKRISEARQLRVKYKNPEEFEARLVLEIYRSLSTSRGVSEF
ncbi:hypothetical protein Dimus_034108 [Dionaea muscipula]